MKLKEFLNKYDTVIFDMDGVITSEQNYWNSAALTVWEYLKWNNGENIDTAEGMERLDEIRSTVFCNDELIGVLKGKGVNSNWDLGYVTVLIAWICGGKNYGGDFSEVLEYAKMLSDNILDEYDVLAEKAAAQTGFDYDWMRRNNLMWTTMQDIFQEWFLGDKLNGRASVHGFKSGLLNREEPIVDKARLRELMRDLSVNRRLCTGTGRPKTEMLCPLEDWGIKQYFAEDGLCNYNYVAAAEKRLGVTLTKPHPYMFLKALYGTDYDDERLLNGDYDKSKTERTLIVGDAGADILAAKTMGADFCAVLTGINGVEARGYFEEMNAEYILDSVLDMETE